MTSSLYTLILFENVSASDDSNFRDENSIDVIIPEVVEKFKGDKREDSCFESFKEN